MPIYLSAAESINKQPVRSLQLLVYPALPFICQLVSTQMVERAPPGSGQAPEAKAEGHFNSVNPRKGASWNVELAALSLTTRPDSRDSRQPHQSHKDPLSFLCTFRDVVGESSYANIWRPASG